MPFGRISFSAGVADAHAYADSRTALRAADEALLRAKEAGRNRVLRAGETGALPPG
jgi:diguanylate cyclase